MKTLKSHPSVLLFILPGLFFWGGLKKVNSWSDCTYNPTAFFLLLNKILKVFCSLKILFQIWVSMAAWCSVGASLVHWPCKWVTLHWQIRMRLCWKGEASSLQKAWSPTLGLTMLPTLFPAMVSCLTEVDLKGTKGRFYFPSETGTWNASLYWNLFQVSGSIKRYNV